MAEVDKIEGQPGRYAVQVKVKPRYVNENCTGCGKCAEVCPVQECIVMVDELRFEDYGSPWEHYRRDKTGYVEWAEAKKGKERVVHPHVTGTGRAVLEGERVELGKVIPARRKQEVTR